MASEKEQPNPELVLHEGARLELISPSGKLAIVAGKGLERQYQWNDCALDADMWARRVRWKGSLGMYDPASRSGLIDLFKYASCKGISRTIVEEGQIHFANVEDAQEWLRHLPQKNHANAWTNDGIVVSWLVSPFYIGPFAMGGLGVDLHLLCINGKRPTRLLGATDNVIKLVYPRGRDQAIRECVKVGNDVIVETQRVLKEDWKWVEESKARQASRVGTQ